MSILNPYRYGGAAEAEMPTRVDIGTDTVGAAGGTLSVSKFAGLEDDDFVIVFVAKADAGVPSGGITADTDWVLWRFRNTQGDDCGLYWWHKHVADASAEPSAWEVTVAQGAAMIVVAWRGVDQTSPFDAGPLGIIRDDDERNQATPRGYPYPLMSDKVRCVSMFGSATNTDAASMVATDETNLDGGHLELDSVNTGDATTAGAAFAAIVEWSADDNVLTDNVLVERATPAANVWSQSNYPELTVSGADGSSEFRSITFGLRAARTDIGVPYDCGDGVSLVAVGDVYSDTMAPNTDDQFVVPIPAGASGELVVLCILNTINDRTWGPDLNVELTNARGAWLAWFLSDGTEDEILVLDTHTDSAPRTNYARVWRFSRDDGFDNISLAESVGANAGAVTFPNPSFRFQYECALSVGFQVHDGGLTRHHRGAEDLPMGSGNGNNNYQRQPHRWGGPSFGPDGFLGPDTNATCRMVVRTPAGFDDNDYLPAVGTDWTGTDDTASRGYFALNVPGAARYTLPLDLGGGFEVVERRRFAVGDLDDDLTVTFGTDVDTPDEDDFIVVIMSVGHDTTMATAAAGWTVVGSFSTSQNNRSLWVAYKKAGAAESGDVTFTTTGSVNSQHVYQWLRFTGIDAFDVWRTPTTPTHPTRPHRV